MQLSDPHWGFSGDAVNPNASVELKNAVAMINAVATKPDFVIFTGDLTHTTDSVDQRRQRMSEFKAIVADLEVPMLKFMPGEHDAAPDAGAVYGEFFGDLHYAFDYKGIHFVALDNVSDPQAKLGDAQLAWLESELAALDGGAPVVVFAHRPLWDLKPEWDWTTADGSKAIDILSAHDNVVVFFGHIHQELHHTTGEIQHHAARSLMFALPTPETPGMRTPVPWDPQHPEHGLGYRQVEAGRSAADGRCRSSRCKRRWRRTPRCAWRTRRDAPASSLASRRSSRRRAVEASPDAAHTLLQSAIEPAPLLTHSTCCDDSLNSRLTPPGYNIVSCGLGPDGVWTAA